MLRLCHSRVSTFTLLATLALTTAVGFSKDGRNFGGFFNLTGLAEQGDRVQVTLALQIFNYSGEDLQEAVVTLRYSHPASGVIETFDPIPVWRNGKSMMITRQVAVTREEYLRWTARGQPNVSVAYRASDGRQQEWTAQLSLRSAPL